MIVKTNNKNLILFSSFTFDNCCDNLLYFRLYNEREIEMTNNFKIYENNMRSKDQYYNIQKCLSGYRLSSWKRYSLETGIIRTSMT